MDDVECVVIGAGVIGLAVARELAESGRETIVLEAEGGIGTGISSRNSEVIHAGIYYPAGSRKAAFCVRGRRMLYAYCEARGVPHRQTGKLIVATEPDQIPVLEATLEKARANGVEGMRLLSKREVEALEPECRAEAALQSDTTGILDAHAFMLALQGDAEAAGAAIAFQAPLERGEAGSDGIVIEAGGTRLRAKTVVNCAGLHATEVASRIDGVAPSSIPPLHYAKGNYVSLAGRAPFSRLIYPVPEPGGLGVHLTLDLGGQARFGPDVEWVDDLDYEVSTDRLDAFVEAIRRYWPDVPIDKLHPSYSGIRPKIGPDPAAFHDFVIQDADAHGVPGLINLYGIESPGLTSSLAIAEHVLELVDARG
ncbi:NAD(P)/FAD-dependent oxidoreductase [Amorphus orientalis]|uniref:L-2-hydroxyglutarate oxidase LhgO n=1 Tax=Amorphus orientalis TaxID=649198 RepID=A0AAE4AU46_9HYPH|nr:NAD(P)/FAD-dependent oxidoreductase [Amorphus orientalis]MDQ0315569.1 L-2-hydroxyglutarate oxidase LhgO [Amorphus orientalis]